MAIQNFVGGGFYGKVGEFVGQRWKNIRTIRAYVIPHNPKTPAQQANRKFFQSAVPLAQIANQAYPHCPAFDTTTNTQWAYRMSEAKLRLEAGEQDVATVPIFPKDYTPPFVISGVTVNEIVNTRQIKIEISGNVPQEARNYSALLYFDDGERAEEMLVCSGKSSDELPNTILLDCGNTLDIDTAKIFCRVFTNNDEKPETIAGSARLQLAKNLTKDFNISTDLEEMNIADDGIITMTFKTPNAWESGLSGSVSANLSLTSSTRSLKNGTQNTTTTNVFTAAASFENIDGSVGVKVVITPLMTQNEVLKYVADGTLNIVYSNVSTPSTNPSSGTKSFDFKPTWNNVQPLFKNDFAQSNISTDTDGNITITYKSSNAYESTLAGTISAALALTTSSRKYKNGTTDTSTSNVFTLSSTVKNVGGFFGLEVVLTSAMTKKNGVSYSIAGNVKVSCAGVYTPTTRPLTEDKNVALSNTWTNAQPAFALSAGYISRSGQNKRYFEPFDMECTVDWLTQFFTNPTTANDKAWQKSLVGKTAANYFDVPLSNWLTMQLKTINPTATETVTGEIEEFEMDNITSETTKANLYIGGFNFHFSNDDYTDVTEPTSFQRSGGISEYYIKAKCKGFYTDDTIPATQDYSLNIVPLYLADQFTN